MLDLVQYHLEQNGFNVRRIDGKLSLQQRANAIRQFSNDPSCTVMLATIGSAGEGCVLSFLMLHSTDSCIMPIALPPYQHRILTVALQKQHQSYLSKSRPPSRTSLESHGRSPSH